jgi:hypothetical protein
MGQPLVVTPLHKSGVHRADDNLRQLLARKRE